MVKITSKDIEALREYLDKLEKLNQEKPKEQVTAEEWQEFFSILEETSKFPEKYKGRIGEKIEVIYTDIVNGKPAPVPEGKEQIFYYDIALEEVNNRYYALQRQYRDSILKVFKKEKPGETSGEKSVLDMIREAVENATEVLDISNLPNLLPTDNRLQYALTPLRNEYAYIMPFDYKQLAFNYDENGEIVIRSQAQYKALEEALDKKNKIEAAGIDQPLLRQLFAATMKAYLCNYGNSITVYLPSFAREMNIDISVGSKSEETAAKKHKANDFFKKLDALEKLNGVWQGGSFYRVFVLEGYDAEQNTLTFSSPWLFKIARELLTNPAKEKTRADGSVIWEITGITSLMKPSIVSARSKPTVEIIATLLFGLKQYGVKPEAKRHPKKKYKDNELVEYTISFKTLIERIPLIMEALDSCKPSNKTTLLQRYFCGSNFKERQKKGRGYILEEYIRNYTYIPEYYKDFEITFNPPTFNKLSDKITIRHKGINGHFLQDNALKEFLFRETPQEETTENQDEQSKKQDGEV